MEEYITSIINDKGEEVIIQDNMQARYWVDLRLKTIIQYFTNYMSVDKDAFNEAVADVVGIAKNPKHKTCVLNMIEDVESKLEGQSNSDLDRKLEEMFEIITNNLEYEESKGTNSSNKMASEGDNITERSDFKNLTISKEKFDKKKKELKTIDKSISTKYDIDKFRTSGGFLGLQDHRVTGAEMNNFVVTMQKILTNIGKTDTALLKEFQKVYDTFDVLDKEYINGIVGNIKTVDLVTKELAEKIEENQEINEASIKCLLDELLATREQLEEGNKQYFALNEEVKRQSKKDEEHDRVLEQQALKDKEHDMALEERVRKDEEHDRVLKQQALKDKEHDVALEARAFKDKEHDIKLAELETRISDLDSKIKESKKYTIIAIIACGISIAVGILALIF